MYAKLLLVAKSVAEYAINNARYIKDFASSDFSSGDNLVVSASEHGRGKKPSADVWRLSGTNYVKSEGYPSDGWLLSVDANGNITLSVDAGNAFSGRIIVT